jgi:ethanolamine permease
MIAGAVLALTVMLTLWTLLGAEAGAAVIGGTLLNMAVFAAMFSYIMQSIAFIVLRRRLPDLPRPFRSPLGYAGPVLTIVIGLITLWFQLSDPTYRQGVIGVTVWFAVCITYFALIGRHRLILSPEESFALEHQARRKPQP